MGSIIVRIGMVTLGIILIVVSIRLNISKKILVNHAVIWSLVGLMAILTGAIPALSGWTKLLAPGTVVVLLGAGIMFLISEYRNSIALSRLTARNRELAMQVALLDHECERISSRLRALEPAQPNSHIAEATEKLAAEQQAGYDTCRDYSAADGFKAPNMAGCDD